MGETSSEVEKYAGVRATASSTTMRCTSSSRWCREEREGANIESRSNVEVEAEKTPASALLVRKSEAKPYLLRLFAETSRGVLLHHSSSKIESIQPSLLLDKDAQILARASVCFGGTQYMLLRVQGSATLPTIWEHPLCVSFG